MKFCTADWDPSCIGVQGDPGGFNLGNMVVVGDCGKSTGLAMPPTRG